MKYNPEIHHRRSIRLQGYDYSQAGAYLETICTQNREYLFGEVIDGEMRLNHAVQIVAEEWIKATKILDKIEIDYYVVMPNHFHGILLITDNGEGTARRAPTEGTIQPLYTRKAICNAASTALTSFSTSSSI